MISKPANVYKETMQVLKGSPILVVDIVFLLDSFQEELLVVLLCCRQDLFVCITPTHQPKKRDKTIRICFMRQTGVLEARSTCSEKLLLRLRPREVVGPLFVLVQTLRWNGGLA